VGYYRQRICLVARSRTKLQKGDSALFCNLGIDTGEKVISYMAQADYGMPIFGFIPEEIVKDVHDRGMRKRLVQYASRHGFGCQFLDD
jgi:hypothetical protein